MDQANSSMEKKNLQSRAAFSQQNSKFNTSDQHIKDLHKKQANGGKKQQLQNRSGGEGDGLSHKRGKGGWGRLSNRPSRNKEKEGGQVVNVLDCSQEDADDVYPTDLSVTACAAGGRKICGRRHDIADGLQSWFDREPTCFRRNNYGRENGARKKKSYSRSGASIKCRKDKLWQARCQFVVNRAIEQSLRASHKLPVGYSAPHPLVEEYSPTHDSPDDKIEWRAVEEVILHMTQDTHCPVCLYSPVAPQVTLCGHVYCYPCILHYLALSDEKGRSCPICYEHVQQEDLKSAVMIVHPDYSVGNTITMILMKRNRESMIPIPVPPNSNSLMTRKITATKQQVSSIVERELTALEVQMCEDVNAPENCFTQQAIGLVHERQSVLVNYTEYTENDSMYSESNSNSEKNSPSHNYVDVSNQQGSGVQIRSTCRRDSTCSSTTSEESGCTVGSLSSLSSLSAGVVEMKINENVDFKECFVTPNSDCNPSSISNNKENNIPEVLRFSLEGEPHSKVQSSADKKKTSSPGNIPPKSTYYFYQAVDGSHVYLYSMNLSMLVTEYGGVEHCPLTITANIMEKDYYVMSESQRNRTKYLRHLPLNCPFETVELNLTLPLVSQDTLHSYSESLVKREKARKAKAHEEKKIEKRNLALQENEFSGRLFKRINSEANSILNSNEIDSPSNDPKVLDQHFPEIGGNASNSNNSSQQSDHPPSFANMVRVKNHNKSAKQNSSPWPTLAKKSPPWGNNNQSTPSPPVWGTDATTAPSPTWGKREVWNSSHSQSEFDELEFNAPDFRQAFSQGLDALFEKQPTVVTKKKKGKKGKRK